VLYPTAEPLGTLATVPMIRAADYAMLVNDESLALPASGFGSLVVGLLLGSDFASGVTASTSGGGVLYYDLPVSPGWTPNPPTGSAGTVWVVDSTAEDVTMTFTPASGSAFTAMELPVQSQALTFVELQLPAQ
jgi:hypothetical protein